ncbi:hypothetical protein DFAR_3060008 [Desulfarculales bacterium]
MGVSSVATGIPTASSWFMNPYFMATFGIIAALGLVIFGITYFLFYVKTRKASVPDEGKCDTCGLTGDILSKLIPCNAHSGLVADIAGIKAWIASHEQDYRRLSARIDALSDKRGS